MKLAPDPLGVSIVRVLRVCCADCGCSTKEHRGAGPLFCTCGLCCGWRRGAAQFMPDRPVPMQLRRALGVPTVQAG